jgi:predicted transposase YbfD/YdcC
LLRQVIHGCRVSAALESFVEPEAKAHGRIESRCGDVFDASDFLSKWPEWSAIKQIIRIKRTRAIIKKGQLKTSVTIAYYASNAIMDANLYAKIIREHWFIENKLHHVRDVAFKEDKAPKRVGALNYAVLLSTALNILRIQKCKNINGQLYINSMDFNRMLNYLVEIVA